jgi:DNA-binding beta-propeller fold protein YncE
LSHVYTAGRGSVVRKLLKSDGSQVWAFTDINDVDALAVDPDGNVYAAENDDPGEVVKINAAGTEVWRRDPYAGDGGIAGHRGIAVDAAGNVYVACNNYNVYKIAADGASHETFATLNGSAMGVVVDPSGNVYVCGSLTFGNYPGVRKYNAAGTLIWTYGDTISWGGVAIDLDGNVYAATNIATQLHKIDPSGNHVWTFTTPSVMPRDPAVDASGNVYIACNGGTVHKVNSSGTQVWEFSEFSAGARCVAVDPAGNVYAAGGNDEAFKINSAGTEVWQSGAATGNIFGIAADPGLYGTGFWPAAPSSSSGSNWYYLA